MRQIEGDEYELTTGKKIYAHNYIIGIDPDLNLFGGYDQTLPDCGPPLTNEELAELAYLMIIRWKRLKDQAERKLT